MSPGAKQQIYAAVLRGSGDLYAGIAKAEMDPSQTDPAGGPPARPRERSEAGQPGPPPWVAQMMRSL
ncbi:MAG TPA: hypothetical protein VFX30_14190 [bacterium]|nr:hypothetical protein [bacterium]